MEPNPKEKLVALVDANLAYWTTVKRALLAEPSQPPRSVTPRPATKPASRPRHRAPAGELKRALAKVASSAPMSNAEFRNALKIDKYPYSCDSITVSKALAELVSEGKVQRIGERNSARYTKAG